MESPIRDTTKMDPLDLLIGSMALPGENYIEVLEKQGQAQLLRRDLIPSKLLPDKASFEALGFKFGIPLESDPLFMPCILPEGWVKEESDHAMWSYIIDTQGEKRVDVFYKAAPYDRRASATLNL